MNLLKQLVLIESRRDNHPLRIIQKYLGDEYAYELMDDILIIYTGRDAANDTDPCVEVHYDALDEVLEISESAGDTRPDITSLYSGSDPAVIAKLKAKAAAASGPDNYSLSLTNKKRFMKKSNAGDLDDDPDNISYDFNYDDICDDIADRLHDLASKIKKFR